ncbi:MAG TPA: hypothetical protein PK795_09575, partial [Bacillota bacterium]|nr:hypothetical protein [Bacillota bacterium]
WVNFCPALWVNYTPAVTLVLCTSRFRYQEKDTVSWLIKNNIPFDDIVYGKPRGILYIDDRGYRFRGWRRFLEDVEF